MPISKSISIYLDHSEYSGVQNQGLNLELYDENRRYYVSHYSEDRPLQSIGSAELNRRTKYSKTTHYQNLILTRVPL